MLLWLVRKFDFICYYYYYYYYYYSCISEKWIYVNWRSCSARNKSKGCCLWRRYAASGNLKNSDLSKSYRWLIESWLHYTTDQFNPLYLLWIVSGGSRGRVLGVQTPVSDLTLVWDWNSYIDRILYHSFLWLIFLMKHALHFATKLNSRDIKKCDCFWVPSYDLFASARKAVFPAPTATGSVHRLRNTWSSLWEVICHTKVQQSFLNQSLDPSNQKFLDPSPIVILTHWSFTFL